MRVGYGYDIHQLVQGRKLIIGGVEIPSESGLLGHSDADVLLHAICDSLLGAAGLGDIGEHFPDTDEKYKDISSGKLLKHVILAVEKKGYQVENIDCIVFSQQIKITPHKEKMKSEISRIIGIDQKKINIKAKTMETLDAVGQNKAIAASSVVLLSGI